MDSDNIKRYHVVSVSPGNGPLNRGVPEQDSFVQGGSGTPASTLRNRVSTSQQTSEVYNPQLVSTNVQTYRTNTVPPGPHSLNTSFPVYTGTQSYQAPLVQPSYQTTTQGNYNTTTMREYNPHLDKDARVVSENVIEVPSGLPARIVREEPVEFVKEIVREIPREYIQRTVFQEPVTYIREVTYDEPVLVMEQVVEREPYAYYKRTVENVQGGQRIISSGGTTVPVQSFPQTPTQHYPGLATAPGPYAAYPANTQMIPATNYVQGAPRTIPLSEVSSRPVPVPGSLQVSQPPPSLVASRGTIGQQHYMTGNSRLNTSRG
ncbi:Hypothetical protein GLP15_1052 [Giardia lamblia P15]|uniref:Uncharacterized protein n=1 Tax=Giardia intestinalis (strain P15) TaxID=658858 RepID=E1F2Y5_GIAIA|nr:Hypothetical protein GLP15_1052 [Giardia lamblia P15]